MVTFFRDPEGRPEGSKNNQKLKRDTFYKTKNCSRTLTFCFFVPVSVEEIPDGFGNLVEEFSAGRDMISARKPT